MNEASGAGGGGGGGQLIIPNFPAVTNAPLAKEVDGASNKAGRGRPPLIPKDRYRPNLSGAEILALWNGLPDFMVKCSNLTTPEMKSVERVWRTPHPFY
jgi:hypothetical protein